MKKCYFCIKTTIGYVYESNSTLKTAKRFPEMKIMSQIVDTFIFNIYRNEINEIFDKLNNTN